MGDLAADRDAAPPRSLFAQWLTLAVWAWVDSRRNDDVHMAVVGDASGCNFFLHYFSPPLPLSLSSPAVCSSLLCCRCQPRFRFRAAWYTAPLQCPSHPLLWRALMLGSGGRLDYECCIT